MAKMTDQAKYMIKTCKNVDPVKDGFRSQANAVARRFEMVGQFFPDFDAAVYAGAWAVKTQRADTETVRRIFEMPLKAFVLKVIEVQEKHGLECVNDRAAVWLAL
jgi:hypothetical protein